MQGIISCYYVKWLEIKLTLHKKWCDTAAVLTLKAAGSLNRCDLVLFWNGWHLYPLSIFFGPQGNEQVSCSLCLQEKQLQNCSLTPVSSIMAFMLLVLKIALTVIQPLRCGYCAFPKWMGKATRVSYISAGWIPQQEEAFSDPPCLWMWAGWSMHSQGTAALPRNHLWQILRPDHIFPSGQGGVN